MRAEQVRDTPRVQSDQAVRYRGGSSQTRLTQTGLALTLKGVQDMQIAFLGPPLSSPGTLLLEPLLVDVDIHYGH